MISPDGAAKTTTMRMLVGLSEPDRGAARILGGRDPDRPNPGRRAGILLEAPAQHAGRRGREALAVSAETTGVPARRVAELPELAGLDEAAARRRVGSPAFRFARGCRRDRCERHAPRRAHRLG